MSVCRAQLLAGAMSACACSRGVHVTLLAVLSVLVVSHAFRFFSSGGEAGSCPVCIMIVMPSCTSQSAAASMLVRFAGWHCDATFRNAGKWSRLLLGVFSVSRQYALRAAWVFYKDSRACSLLQRHELPSYYTNGTWLGAWGFLSAKYRHGTRI
jgi:hypothetical protein